MKYLHDLRDVRSGSEAGNKAWRLADAARLGLPVPAGWVIDTSALRAVLHHNGLDADDRSSATCSQEQVLGAELPEELEQELRWLWREHLADRCVAVRSSAIGEDGARASFAGQLQTTLNVGSWDEFLLALRRCWASRWAANVAWYEQRHGVRVRGMGVLVQPMIDAVVSGVLFSSAPHGVAESARELYGEWCSGTGEKLVQGEVNPTRFWIGRDTGELRIEPDHAAEQALAPRAARELARILVRLEAEFRGPQDLEWAVDRAERVWLLQARPITAQAAPPRRVSWTNTNLCENYPLPLCPLQYSIARASYYHYFRNLGTALGVSERRLAELEPSLRNLVGAHGGRLYYNLTAIHACLRALPKGDAVARSFDLFVGAAQDAAPASEAKGESEAWRELAALGASTVRRALGLGPGLQRFERAVDAYVEAVAALTGRAELVAAFHAFLQLRFRRWTDAALCDAAAMLTYAALKALIAHWLPDLASADAHNTLLSGLDGLVSSEPVLALWKATEVARRDSELVEMIRQQPPERVLRSLREEPRHAALRAQLDDYLARWGFRFSGELMIDQPDLRESPQVLVGLLSAYLDAAATAPDALLASQRSRRLALERELRERLSPAPWRAAALMASIRAAQHSLRLRERARLKQAQLYRAFRQVCLRLGAILQERGDLPEQHDIFLLSFEEVEQCLGGAQLFPELSSAAIAQRRAQHAERADWRLPGDFELPAGEQATRALRALGRAQLDGEAASVLRGQGVCTGQVAGPARVISGLSEAARLRSGDVLIAPQTDPGWAPLFGLIAGLVIERGGMLSHAAILARELGVPTVAGVADATQLIPDGARVALDGAAGRVSVCAST